ncbi:MAG: xanthine dehydrogenase family protein subunit M [Chloroflexota bacterium]|nr:xanthine dehydrogenase family protein subunit M [Chloroflexota bacterium]
MKPAPFQYFAPDTLEEALSLLTQHGDAAKVLAGGQSLIPTMNFRLAQPAVLIDLNNVADLFYIDPAAEGGLRIGAMTRQRTVERDALIQQQAPLLHATMPHIAHTQIRNRGTIGGSLAHADPAAELPAVAVTLDAQLRVRSQIEERWIAARDFYIGLFTTALAPDEILVEIAIPPLPPRTGCSIQEIARRRGDYAIVGVTALVTLDGAGRCSAARIALLSVGEGPVQTPQAVQMLIGETPTPELIVAAAQTLATVDIDPTGDIHASAAYRRHLANVLSRNTLTQAFQRAGAIL